MSQYEDSYFPMMKRLHDAGLVDVHGDLEEDGEFAMTPDGYTALGWMLQSVWMTPAGEQVLRALRRREVDAQTLPVVFLDIGMKAQRRKPIDGQHRGD